MDTNLRLEVCFSPALLHLYDISDTIVVVIDIFRATSSMVYGIENGAKAIIPVEKVEQCLTYKDKGYLLAAERNGSVVEGFDFGNSPFSYTSEKVKDQTIVLTTTNGTKAISYSAATAKEVVIGSFLNLNALCKWLEQQNSSVLLLCAGWKDNFNLEDTVFAGAVIDQLKDKFKVANDSAIAAYDMFTLAKNDLNLYLSKTSHGERLKKLNIEADIEFCLHQNIATAIPILRNGKLVAL